MKCVFTGHLFGTGRLFLYAELVTGCLFGRRHLFEPGVYTVKYGTYLVRLKNS